MTSRERLVQALNHKEPDRVPCDIGSTPVTGIAKKAYDAFIKYVGIQEESSALSDVLQQLAEPSEKFLQYLEIDTRAVTPNNPSNWELKIEDEGDYYCFTDEWNIRWSMPKEKGFYYDMVKNPLTPMTITIDELNAFNWPDANDSKRYEGLREKALAIQKAGYAVVAQSVSAGIGELGGWLRGYENYYVDMAISPKETEYYLDKILDFKLKYWEKVLDLIGDIVDVVQEADDLGSQNNMLISPDLYRKYLKPRHKKLFDLIKSKSNAKIFLHSCGSFYEVIPDLIEIGLDILNPVQFNAKNMESIKLKKEFGKDLVFWGGGVDSQRILPTGTPKQVKECVKRQIEELAPGGGFVFTNVHNIQADVPPQNLMAMWEAYKQFRNY